MRAGCGKIDSGNIVRRNVGQQCGPVIGRDWGNVDAGGPEDRRFHHFRLRAGGDVENLALEFEIAAHIVVVGVDGQLPLAAGGENHGTGDDQWPERLQLGFLKRVDRVIGLDGRDDVEGIAFGVVEQRGAGDGEVAHQPALNDVAEIDHPIRNRLPMRIRVTDDIVVGDVVMDRLHAKPACKRLDALDGCNHCLGDAVARLVIGDRRQELHGNRPCAAQVPLQAAVKTGMVEIREIAGEPGREGAERRDRGDG